MIVFTICAEKVCYKVCNAYSKVLNMCSKALNKCYKVCNKNYLYERENYLADNENYLADSGARKGFPDECLGKDVCRKVGQLDQ